MNDCSVFQLITRLCETYINGNLISGHINKINIKKIRSKCYEILLSKKLIKSHQYLQYNSDALCNLLGWHLYLSWEGNVPEHTEKLHLCINKLQELNVFDNSTCSNVISLLIQLRNVPKERHSIMDTTLNRDALQSCKTNSWFNESIFDLPENSRKEFDSTQFNLPRNILCVRQTFKSVFKTSEENNVIYFQRTRVHNFECTDEGYESPSNETDMWEIALHKPCNNHRTWETFGELFVGKELPFVCEAGSQAVEWLHNLTALEEIVAGNCINTMAIVNKITRKEFIKCVKYLLVGIESCIFKYNNAGELTLVPGISIEGLSFCAINSYCKELLKCSSCYKGLYSLYSPTDLKTEQHGYIFLELCASIKRYLSYYRVAILSLSDTLALLTFHEQTRLLRVHVMQLASVCKVGPFKESGVIPHGVTLLNYLYNKVTSVINEESLMVLYAVIYPCCKVYFKRFLQQWMLEGMVLDASGEFFININSKYINSRGRTYWTRSFSIREDVVPEFLADLRQEILFCGKAMSLLKLCVPNSTLCLYLAENHPNILHCCLTPDQLSDIEYNNYSYYLKTTALSGPRVVLADIISQSHEQNSLFLHLIAKKRAATLTRIELERKKKLQSEFDKKQSQMRILKDQYHEAMVLKKIATAREVEKEMRLVETNIKLQTLQNKIIEEEKTLLIQYYDKLTSQAEKRWHYYKQQIEHLKCELNFNPEIELKNEESKSPGSKCSLNSIDTPSAYSSAFDYEPINEDALADTDNCLVSSDEALDVNANADENVDIPAEEVSENYQLFIENKKAAEKNKAKVLLLEMQDAAQTTIKNVDPPALTEAQKNRLKVMSTEFGIEFPAAHRKRNIHSAAEINKTKMLASNECFVTIQSNGNYTKQTTPCDNENYTNRNLEIDINTNVVEDTNLTESETLIENLAEIKNSKKLSLDFSKIEPIDCHPNQVATGPKFELQKFSPMSIDSASISSVTTPNVNIFDNLKSSPTATTARTEVLSEDCFVFESDCMIMFKNFKKQKTELEHHSDINSNREISNTDTSKISPGCLKFCLQQSVLIPLITQTKLVTNELLKYYINDLKYLQHLNSLRNYFFLLDGEFCRNITEGLFGKLYDVNFPIDLINVHTLKVLMYNALDYSTKCQENSDCLSFKINNLPKVFNLCDPDVFDCISLVYKISWPLNILLPIDTVSKYDDVFKLLIKVHRVSWVLQNMFQDLKLLGKEIEKQYRIHLMNSSHYRHLHHYRHIMTQFIQSLQNYIVGEVLQSSWHVFETNLKSATSFDQLYVLHANYIKHILFLCLLNQKSVKLRTALQKLFIVIFKFYSYLHSRCWSISDDNVYIHPNFNKLESLFSNFEELALYFFKLGHKVVKSGYQPQLRQLLDMLDLNNYYTKKLRNSLNSLDVL